MLSSLFLPVSESETHFPPFLDFWASSALIFLSSTSPSKQIAQGKKIPFEFLSIIKCLFLMSIYLSGFKLLLCSMNSTRKGSAASTTSTAASKARDSRRQRNRGKIRPGSPGEELALVDHLKGMSLTAGAKHELKSLLVSLVMLGEKETALKLQCTGENFQLSQMAAVKLAEDAMSTDVINEHAHNLERYMKIVRRELPNSDAFFWRSKVFLCP